jgi:hypothetical protein
VVQEFIRHFELQELWKTTRHQQREADAAYAPEQPTRKQQSVVLHAAAMHALNIQLFSAVSVLMINDKTDI